MSRVRDDPKLPQPSSNPYVNSHVEEEVHEEPDDGVDVTLVRWFLSLTPQERLNTLQANANAAARFRNAANSGR